MSHLLSTVTNTALSLVSAGTTVGLTLAQGAQDACSFVKNCAMKTHEVASNALTSASNGLAAIGAQLSSNPQAIPELIGGAYDAFARSADELFGGLCPPTENDYELTHELVLANNDETFTPKPVASQPSASPKSVAKAQARFRLASILSTLYLLIRYLSVLYNKGKVEANKFYDAELNALKNGALLLTDL